MKLEIGGGNRSGAPERINIDMLPNADIVWNLDCGKLPVESDSVDDLYTAHCLEHVLPVHDVVGEILRVCKVGSRVEIRVPHWLHPMASCPGHHHVISDRQLYIWCEQPYSFTTWPKEKKFRLVSMFYQKDAAFESFQKAFPWLHHEFIVQHMPGCCHEVRCAMEVVDR